MFKHFHRFLILVFIGSFLQYHAASQCVTIINLPDTIDVCKNTSAQLTANVVASGLLVTLDTTWTPAAGLSNPNIINPIATVGTTSVNYTLHVVALTPTNYVANGDFSSGNTGFTTSYLLGTGGSFGLLSNEGTYAVTTNPSVVHSNFASFPDHTGNAGGQMLVVNGSATPNTNVWCQTITVIPNSDYDFSAWGASCVGSNPAILQFAINGNLLGSPLALSIVTGQWSQFHALWNSGSNTSITICITDQATAPSGNDFAIDDIEFRQLCTASDSVYLRVTNLRPDISKILKPGCAADTVEFTAINNGGDAPDQYFWEFGDGTGSQLQNPTHIYPTQGQYNIKLVTKKRGCADSASLVVDTRHPLAVSLTSDKDTVCFGTAIQFDNSGDQTTTTPTYFYDFGDGTTGTAINPSYTYTAVGTYTVKHAVTDQVPCSDTATKIVVVVAAPTANFTMSANDICQGGTIDFTASATQDYDSLLWDYGDGTILIGEFGTRHAYDTSGNFTVNLTVGYPQCPTIMIAQNLHVWEFPQVNIGPDTSICPNGAPLPLTNLYPDPNAAHLWNNGSTAAGIFAAAPGVYSLTNTNTGGCATTDSITILNACYLDIPNAFTPNGDGINDYFFPRQLLGSKLTRFSMQIYDRWGQLIFSSAALDGRGWDGKFNDKIQPSGVYIYLIEAQINGGATEKYQGNISLLR